MSLPKLVILLAGGAIGLFAPVGIVKWFLQKEPEDAGILTLFFLPALYVGWYGIRDPSLKTKERALVPANEALGFTA